MLDQKLVKTVTRLPFEQRLSLLELLAQSLRADSPARKAQTSSLTRVRGMIKPDGALPSNQALRDEYIDHLIKKYN